MSQAAPPATAEFERHRRHLAGLAYRMLGSVAEAEDIVQEAWLRWDGADRKAVENPRAYLSRTVTRLCLDHLRSARARRETYVGTWLPEPLLEDMTHDMTAELERADELSVALLLALERLSPLERAAFLLHDVFDMSFAEVAGTLDRDEAACRQLASRARRHVQAEKPRFDVSDEEGGRIADAFFTASRSGDTAALQALLAEQVVLHADGGGIRPAVAQPILGRDKVVRFFEAFAPVFAQKPSTLFGFHRINGLPGFATMESGDTLQTTALEIEDGRIVAIYVMRNPEKLEHVRRTIGNA